MTMERSGIDSTLDRVVRLRWYCGLFSCPQMEKLFSGWTFCIFVRYVGEGGSAWKDA